MQLGKQYIDRIAPHPQLRINHRAAVQVLLTAGDHPVEIKARGLAPHLTHPRLRSAHAGAGHRSAPGQVPGRYLAIRPYKDYIQSYLIWSIDVRYSSQIKPISYLKANAAEVLTHLAEQREPLVITQNGEAKAVLQDVASFEETQEALALLKILALGNQDVAAGKVKPVADVVARLRAKRDIV